MAQRLISSSRPWPRTRLGVQLLEPRETPSASIPISGAIWTPVGPQPIVDGQAPGKNNTTGPINGIAVDADEPNIIYAAAATGGVWRTLDGGKNWSPRTDRAVTLANNTLAALDRGPDDGTGSGNTVYVATEAGVLRSVDGAETFAATSSFIKFLDGSFAIDPFTNEKITLTGKAGNPLLFSRLIAAPNPSAPDDPNADILYLGLERGFFFQFFGSGLGPGVYRSLDGGDSWTEITQASAGQAPFFTAFPTITDIAVDPTNLNVLYVAAGSPIGDASNGIYRTLNGLSSAPVFTNQIGGSAFVPGTLPGNIKLAVSPVLPSVIFASVAERAEPTTGVEELLDVFRSLDGGNNWTRMNLDPVTQNYLGIEASNNNVIIVDPSSPADPFRQRVIVGGYGDPFNNFLISGDSGATFADISVDENGDGPGVNSKEIVFDSLGRLLVANSQGVYRLSFGPLNWEALNGTVGKPAGSTALSTVQVFGVASHPTDPNRLLANIGVDHNAALFNDSRGWKITDTPTQAPFQDDREGIANVIWNYNQPETIYRQALRFNAGDPGYLRRSTDGGQTWVEISAGITGLLNPDRLRPVQFLLDPSVPNRLFVGTDRVNISNNNGNSWGNLLQTGSKTKVAVPDLPSSNVPRDKGGEILITALSVTRSAGGQRIYAATEAWNNADNDNFLPGFSPRLFVIEIPDAPPQQPLTPNNWIELTAAPGLSLNLGFVPVTQLVVDPANQNVLYAVSTKLGNFGFSGSVLRSNDAGFSWVDLTGNLGDEGRLTLKLVLDPNNPAVDDDDALFLGTDDGVYALFNPAADPTASPPNWVRFGDSIANPTLPNVRVNDLDLNTTTGILTAGTFGRGVWQIRIRGLIRGQVFEDLNGNKLRDQGEPPLAGWTVVLRDGSPTGPQVAATVTDAEGFYEFASLRDSTYYVEVITQAGFVQTTKLAQPQEITLTTAAVGESVVENTITPPGYLIVPELDVGVMRFASVSGVVFSDTNANGVFEIDESGREGITVYLDANGNGQLDPGELNVVTDFSGAFLFTKLGPGPHRVRVVVPPNEELTTPPPIDLFPGSGKALVVPPAGLTRIARVAGSVFDDRNGNGVRDPGEPGLANALVKLVVSGTGQDYAQVKTDAGGGFLFRNLEPNTYRLVLVENPDRFQTTATPPPFVVTPTDKLSGFEFGSFARVSLGGVVFNDLNGNGVRDPGEPGLPNWTILLLDQKSGTKLNTANTDANGAFAFTGLKPGGYRVREQLQSGFTQTTPNPADVTVGPPGAKLTGYEFGNFQFASIRGVVFEDLNRNQVRDVGEPGLGGVTVYIDLNNNGQRDLDEPARVTAADGSYLFEGLLPRIDPANPGQFLPYSVRQVTPANFEQTTANPAGFFATSGAVGKINFGIALIGSIGGDVFNDLNGNGVRDAGEPGLGGVTVQLLDPIGGGVLRSVTTTAGGGFQFQSLGAGNYRVRQLLPAGAVQTSADPSDLVLNPSVPAGGISFGNFFLASIEGKVFADLNANGKLDAGEPGLAGFTVFIDTNLNGKPDAGEPLVVTDATGLARFNNLRPGVYQLRQVDRDGFTPTTPVPAPAIPSSGGTASGTLFGNFQNGGVSGLVFLDRNGNGEFDEGEPGLSGFVIRLDSTGDGVPDQTRVTDQFGKFAFLGLGPGTYTVTQAPRTGFVLAGPTDGYAVTLDSGSLVPGLNFANTSPAVVAVGADAGGLPLVDVRNVAGVEQGQFAAYDLNFRGGVRVATGFVNISTPTIVTAPGPGGGPDVRVFDATTQQLRASFFAYDAAFPGGVYVAVGDVTGDGVDDIVTGADAGGGPHVRVFDGSTLNRPGGPVIVREFFPYDPRFEGGVRVGVGDVDGDGRADIVTAPGIGGGPHVRVFSGASGVLLGEFFAYAPAFGGGVHVAAGDITGDGRAEIITGAGRSGGPHVRAFTPAGSVVRELFAYPLDFRGGVRVAASDLDFDGRFEILTSPGPGRTSEVRGFDANTLVQDLGFRAFDPTFLGGVFVG